MESVVTFLQDVVPQVRFLLSIKFKLNSKNCIYPRGGISFSTRDTLEAKLKDLGDGICYHDDCFLIITALFQSINSGLHGSASD